MTSDIYRYFTSPDKSKSVAIVYDNDCSSPRNADGLETKMIVLLDKYGNLGDKHNFTDLMDLKAAGLFDQSKYVAWPLFAIDHSGIHISREKSPGHDWDTSQIGWLFGEIIDGDLKQTVEIMQADIDEYNMWLAGETYGVIVSDVKACPCCGKAEETEDDSCYGIIGIKDALNIAACLCQSFDIKIWTEVKPL